jgi:hypothetical protein
MVMKLQPKVPMLGCTLVLFFTRYLKLFPLCPLIASCSDIKSRTEAILNEYRQLTQQVSTFTHQTNSLKERIKENFSKINMNRALPYLVANLVEVSCHFPFLYQWLIVFVDCI